MHSGISPSDGGNVRPRVAVALGSGGARGYAHIGVLNELRDRGYEIVAITGSSMGALVGGLAAAGVLDEFASWATTLSQRSVLRLLDPAWSGAGIFRAERVLTVVRSLLGDTLIEELPIPFTAVATDLIAGESTWLQDGPLDAAIRASIAIPGVISPYVLGGRVLADGGILDPLPVAPLAGVRADLWLAVNVNGDDDPRPDDALRCELRTSSERLNRLLHSTSALIDTRTAPALLGRFAASGRNSAAVALAGNPTQGPAAPRLSGVEVMSRTIEAMQAALVNNQLAAYPPDVVVDVPRSACRTRDFHRANEIIELGHARAAQALDACGRDARGADRN